MSAALHEPLRRPQVRWPRVWLFFGLTLLVTTLLTLGWTLSGHSWQGSAATLVLNLCMLVPGVVAFALTRFVYREPTAPALGFNRPNWRWMLFAWLMAPTLMLLTLATGLLIPGTAFAPDLSGLTSVGLTSAEIEALLAHTNGFPGGAVPGLLAQGLLSGPTLLSIGGLGEELGWRGFLHTELAGLKASRRSAMVGLLWGVWHLPAVFQGYAYPHSPLLGALLLLALTQVLAPLYSLLRERSGSIFAPMVFHGTCSATSAIGVAFIQGGNELLTGFTGLAGVIAAALVAIATGTLSRRFP